MPNNMTTISCDSLDHFFLSKNELIKKKKEVIIFQFIRWLGHFNEEEKKTQNMSEKVNRKGNQQTPKN